MRIRRYLSVLALLALAISTVAPTTAHDIYPNVAHYASSCASGNGNYNPRAHVVRPLPGTATPYYKRVQGEMIVRDLYPCTSPTSSDNGWSIVAVANLQGSSAFVQTGYAEQACSGNCQNGFVNGVRDFWYTKYDWGQQYGVIYAATWVDFNGDGQHDYPQVGAEYRWTIQTHNRADGSPVWKIIITRTSDGVSDFTYVDRHGGATENAWWGFEVYNNASALGSRAIDSDAAIVPMQYMTSSGTVWTTVTNQPECYGDENLTVGQVCDVYDQSGTGWSVIRAFTNSHT